MYLLVAKTFIFPIQHNTILISSIEFQISIIKLKIDLQTPQQKFSREVILKNNSNYLPKYVICEQPQVCNYQNVYSASETNPDFICTHIIQHLCISCLDTVLDPFEVHRTFQSTDSVLGLYVICCFLKKSHYRRKPLKFPIQNIMGPKIKHQTYLSRLKIMDCNLIQNYQNYYYTVLGQFLCHCILNYKRNSFCNPCQ